MSEWKETHLGEILPFNYGKGLPGRKRSGTGEFHVVSSAGIVGTHNTPLTSGPSIVIGRKGTIGSLHYYQNPVWPIDTAFYLTESDHINLRFAYYLLHTLPLTEMNNDSAVPGLNRKQAEALKVRIPDLSLQRRIAGVLGVLDDKIDSNHKIAALCDRVATYTFEKFSFSKLKLSEVAEIRMGMSPPGSSYNENGEGTPFFQGVRDFTFRHPEPRVYTNAPKRFAEPGDILFSVRAPVGRLNVAHSTCCIGRGLASITPRFPSICYYALKASKSEWEKFSAEGTIFGSVNQTSLKSTLIPWPSQVNEASLEARLRSLTSIISQKELESRKLAELRDALLPELMSGRMRVSEAGRLINSVLQESAPDTDTSPTSLNTDTPTPRHTTATQRDTRRDNTRPR